MSSPGVILKIEHNLSLARTFRADRSPPVPSILLNITALCPMDAECSNMSWFTLISSSTSSTPANRSLKAIIRARRVFCFNVGEVGHSIPSPTVSPSRSYMEGRSAGRHSEVCTWVVDCSPDRR